MTRNERRTKAATSKSKAGTRSKAPQRKQMTAAQRKKAEEQLDTALKADTSLGRKFRQVLHDELVGHIYLQQIGQQASGAMSEGSRQLLHAAAVKYGSDVIARMQPRDPIEEMLLSQLIWSHGRVAHLSMLANQQTDVHTSQQINDSADKASNTYRRLMQAFIDYRRPPRHGDGFTAIGQANFANQQVVHNAGNRNSAGENVTNEQGYTNGQPHEPQAPPALPADAGGVEIASPGRQAHEAVETQHRPEDGRR